MKRWALGGAIVAVVVLAIVIGAVGLLAPRIAVHSRAVVSATAPATIPAGTAAQTNASQTASTATWGVSSAAASEVPSVTPLVKVKAPIAVRARKPFTASGTITHPSATETVTVQLERQVGSTWVTDQTATTMLAANGTFSLRLTPPHGGHLKVVAMIPPDNDHRAGVGEAAVHGVGPKVVALTFDDGPWPGSTQAILGILAKNDVHATFFELGSQVKSQPKRSKMVVAGGNIIGVHTWNHALMTKRSSAANKADLRTTKNVIWKVTGVAPVWFRPPYGSTNKSIAKIARSVGLKQVLWSVDTLDWKYRSTPSIVTRALKGAGNGAIVLMHDGGGPRKATVGAVPIVIKRLRSHGYDFATLDEMAALGYKVR